MFSVAAQRIVAEMLVEQIDAQRVLPLSVALLCLKRHVPTGTAVCFRQNARPIKLVSDAAGDLDHVYIAHLTGDTCVLYKAGVGDITAQKVDTGDMHVFEGSH